MHRMSLGNPSTRSCLVTRRRAIAMIEVEIICINKDGGHHQNPYEAVAYYGWRDMTGQTSRYDRQTMVDWVEKGNRAYVKGSSTKVYCRVVVSPHGTKSVSYTH